jgi:hypothetical protein
MNRIFDTLTSPWFSEYDRLDNYNSGNWRFVVAEKRTDEQLFSYPIWKVETKIYTYNRKTGDFFTPFSVDIIAFNSFLLFLTNPIRVEGTALYHAGKAIFEPVIVFFKAIKLFTEHYRREPLLKRISRTIFTSVCILTTSVTKDLYYLLRDIFYGIGLQIAYLEGFLSDPYRARVKIGVIERAWNHQISYKTSFCVQCPKIDEFQKMSWKEYFQRLKKVETVYIATCMQKRGNIHGEQGSPKKNWRILHEAESIKTLRKEHSEYFPDMQQVTLHRICTNNPDNFAMILDAIQRDSPKYLEKRWWNSAKAEALDALRMQDPEFYAVLQKIQNEHPEYFDPYPEELLFCPISRGISLLGHWLSRR